MGKQIISELKNQYKDVNIIAVGTNSNATSAMLKAGADKSATGQNPVVVCSRSADIIIGPIGIVIADSMLGEVTEKMALSVARSNAHRILVPVSHCDNNVVGVDNLTMKELVAAAVKKVGELLDKQNNNFREIYSYVRYLYVG